MTANETQIATAKDAFAEVVRAAMKVVTPNNLALTFPTFKMDWVTVDFHDALSAALTAALSDQAGAPKASQGIVRSVGWIRNDDVDPNDEDAVRFFGVVVEYPNEPPTFSPSIVWAKTPVCIVPAPPPSSTAGEGK